MTPPASGSTSQEISMPAGHEKSLSLLFSGTVTTPQAEEQQDRSFERDLNIDQIVTAVAGSREERDLIASTLSGQLRDADTVRYRQEVFQDLEDLDLLDKIQHFTGQIGAARAHLRQLTDMPFPRQREGWLLDAVALYCETVQSLATYLTTAPLRSRALLAFREYLASYVASDDFGILVTETRQQKETLGRIRYCTRIRSGRVEVTRYQGEPDYSDAVLRTFDRFKQGAAQDYRIHYRTWPGMNHVAAQITDLVARLFPDEFAALTEYCDRNAGFFDRGIQQADRELQFYLAYLDYIKPLQQAGLYFCYPEVSASRKEVRVTGAFDLALASKLVPAGQRVISNDFWLAGGERIFVVTGPNQGGKTTFARTFGQLHHLASVGCPVPGRRARTFLFDHLFTHFAREEDLARMSGKLEDDLTRMTDILHTATPGSIVILNEIFSSTTLHDARFLGTKLLTKLLQLDVLGVYVTFVDELATLSDQVVSMMSTIVPENPAERTYKVVRKSADGLAYALAIAEKYRLTYDQLSGRLAS